MCVCVCVCVCVCACVCVRVERERERERYYLQSDISNIIMTWAWTTSAYHTVT